jgi:hypothetical protein
MFSFSYSYFGGSRSSDEDLDMQMAETKLSVFCFGMKDLRATSLQLA